MNYNEFADKIKAKYPEYSDMDNRELAEKIVNKYPNDYNDVTFDEPEQMDNNPQVITGGISKDEYINTIKNMPLDILGRRKDLTDWTTLNNKLISDKTLSLEDKKALFKQIKDTRDMMADWQADGERSVNNSAAIIKGTGAALGGESLPALTAGAALFGLGDGILERKTPLDTAKEVGLMAAGGQLLSKTPQVISFLSKTPIGKTVVNNVKPLLNKAVNSEAAQKIANLLTKEIKLQNKSPKINQNFENELDNLLNPKDTITNPNKRKAIIGDVSDETIKVAKENNIDLTGYKHIIDNGGKNHIKNSHTNADLEIKRGQIPITEEDLKQIPEIIYNPDNVEFLASTKSKPVRFRYTKQMDDGTIGYVEFVANKQKQLKAKTMYKTARDNYASLNDSHLRTSETLPSNNSITQNTKNVKTPDTKTSQLGRSDFVNDIFGHNINKDYEVLSNEELINAANKEITKNANSVQTDLLTKGADEKAEFSALDFEKGRQLISQLYAENRADEAAKLTEVLTRKGTQAGQAVQAMSLWGRTTPDGAEMLAQRVINKYNDAHPKKPITLTPEKRQQIRQLAENIQKVPDGYEKDFATATMLKEISDVVPKSASDKFRTLRNISLLLNPKTFNRNLSGNTILGGAENLLTKPLASGIDKVTSLATGKRSRVTTQGAEYLKGLWEGAKRGNREVLAGVNTRNLGARYDLPNTRTFNGGNTERTQIIDILNSGNKGEKTLQYFKDLIPKSRVGQSVGKVFSGDFKGAGEQLGKIPTDLINSLEVATDWSLRVPDSAFYQASFEESLVNQIRTEMINQGVKVKKLTPELIEKYTTPKIVKQATQEALEAVYQNNGAFSNFLSGLRKNLRFGQDFGVGDVLLPYAQTPANVAEMGLNYSPLGLVKGGVNLAKGNQRQGTLDLARGLIGTGLGGLGYGLAKSGVITPNSENTREKLNKELLGERPNTIKIGDNYYSYNQLQPLASPLSAGASMGNSATPLEAIDSYLGTILDTSMMRGANQLIEDTERFGPTTAIANGILGLPSQLIPTGLNQVNAYIDPIQRETYDPNPIKRTLNYMGAKIPVVSKSLPARYNLKGEEKQKYESQGIEKAWDVFANPIFKTKAKDDLVVKELIELQKSTGENVLLPLASKKISKADNLKLSGKQYSEYQKVLGEKTYEALEDLINSQEYINANDMKRAALAEQRQRIVKAFVDEALFGTENQYKPKGKDPIKKIENKVKKFDSKINKLKTIKLIYNDLGIQDIESILEE